MLMILQNRFAFCFEGQSGFVDSRGHLVFDTIPMSFHDQSGRITDYWTQFYAERGLEVPEGQPGTNPGELSQRSLVSIIGRLTPDKSPSQR